MQKGKMPMNRARWSSLLVALLWMLDGNRALAEHPPAGKVRIADRAGDDFQSIQAAIEAAADGATILIGAGRYDERLRITRPIKLFGAGPEQTIIGPTAEIRDVQDEAFGAGMKAIRREAEAGGVSRDMKDFLRMDGVAC